MKKHLIVCLTWLFLCKISMAQKKTDSYVYSEKDVIISTVQHFDTLYCFYNLKKNPPFVKNRIFDNQAKLYYWSDTLDIPQKTISGRKFAKNMLKPHSFHKEVGYTFLHRVILPAIKDSMLYYRVKNSFTDEWQPHSSIVKIIEEGEAHYKIFTYNTSCFLSVYIRARRFNYEYNRIYSSPVYLFPKKSQLSDCYIRFLIPLFE